jgi:hypothetical protein
MCQLSRFALARLFAGRHASGNIKAEVSPGVYLKSDRIIVLTGRCAPSLELRAAVTLPSGPARITPARHAVEQSVVKLDRVGLCRVRFGADADPVAVNGFRLTGLFSAIFGRCEKISFASNLVLSSGNCAARVCHPNGLIYSTQSTKNCAKFKDRTPARPFSRTGAQFTRR